MESVTKVLKKSALPLCWVVVALYGAACLYLFYMQSLRPLGTDVILFDSDLPDHLNMILEDGWLYSFTAYIYLFLNFLTPGNTVLVAVVLAAVTIGAVLLTEKLLRIFLDKEKITALTLGGAMILNMVMPFFWARIGAYRYVSYQSGNVWHNSTYLFMKPGALIAILLFLEIEKNYAKKIQWKHWLGFCLALIVTTGIKPSFLTVFAPAMALKLLWDLFHKVPFKQIFIFGCAVLPACGVMLWQNSVLFGESTEQGFTIDPWFTFSLHAETPKIAVLCSIAFPLTILVFSVFELLKDKHYAFAWLMTLVGFLEALLLCETGSRARHGNFLWGYFIAIFYIFVVSFVKWLKLWKNAQTATNAKLKWLYRAMFFIGGLVLYYQTYCGIVFFTRLLEGDSYFMMKYNV